MVSRTELRAGALRLSDVLMQGITHIAPATALLFTIQFTTSNAGVTAPFAYLSAFLIVVVLGVCLMQLARHLPSAGGYYTYVSRTVHPRAGFLASWLYFLYDPTLGGFTLAFIGSIFQEVSRSHGLLVPWWLFLFAAGSFVAFVTYRGIELSARMLMLFGAGELIIVFALSVWGFFAPGPGGLSLRCFVPATAPSAGGLYLGVVFSIFALTGWEGIAPLAEESEDPRRNLPRAILISILLMGSFLVICSWGVLTGWGTDRLGEFAASEENPTFVLARRYWGAGWLVVLLALLNSMVAVAIAGNNAATRVWFAMARSGSLPKALAVVHPRYRTPVNAVKLQTALMFAVGLGLGWWIGPEKEFEFMGNVLTFALILIYSAGNLGVTLYYYRERRREFNGILHLLFPITGTAALLFVGYNSLHPWPPAPVGYAPWVVAGWLLIGIAVLLAMSRRGTQDWQFRAGAVADDVMETPRE